MLIARTLLPLVGLSAAVAGAVVAAAAPAVDDAFFHREVRPVLEKRCLGCHGVGTRLGKLDLRSRESALKGGGRGPALAPGSAEKSLLWQYVSGQRTPVMPPSGKLPATELEVLRRWLDGGAPWPSGSIETAASQTWWSFRPPRAARVPSFTDAAGRAWVRNPIDAFVLARLRAEGLSPSPPASRPALIRRAYLALIGLPPAPEEVDAFVADRSPDAWEKVVDRLLASPHYGERWGRHWLDLVRYADSSGFEGDKDRPNAWRYRDYVLDAFNRDKPYTEFLREQLAGDEIRPQDREAIIATGYLAMGPEDFAMAKLPTTRADELDDLVSTTGSVFLGLTLGCARCHDHKYDPVAQVDYYRLQALFAPTVRREAEVPTPEERRAWEARSGEIEAELKPLRERLEPLRKQGLEAAMKAGHAKPTEEQIAAALPEAERKSLQELQAAVKAVEAKRPELPKAITLTDAGPKWEPVHLLIRGDAYQKGPVVQPGFIRSLPGGEAEVPAAASGPTTGRRRALAEWVTSPENPLTARVWMNRVWRQHFGRGIVNSTSNFGLNGDLPSHPELLDWLALAFMKDGARLKPIHRMILLSSTWKQASAQRPDAMKKDPQNRFLWRMPVRRLEAEAIRDSMLAVSGTLNREAGGPPVYPPVDPSLRADTYQGINWPEGEDSPKTWRRSVYVKVKRSLLLPQLEVFDCPEITTSVAQRNVTTTPTQALLLMNDPLIRNQARHFAARLEREAGADPARQVERAYRLAFGRPPTARETELGTAFLKKRTLADFCHAVLNLNEFIYVP